MQCGANAFVSDGRETCRDIRILKFFLFWDGFNGCWCFSLWFLRSSLQSRSKTRPAPIAISPTPPQSGPSSPSPPSYEAVMSRRESQPSSPVSSNTDYTDSAPLSPLSPLEGEGIKNPFERDAIGRQSMSEKRGRATLDAKQSYFFVNRERLKEDKGLWDYIFVFFSVTIIKL